MKIALLWPAGDAGRALLKMFTDRGDFVYVYTDRPNDIKLDSVNYEVQRGPKTDDSAMERTISNADIVVCIPEPVRGSRKDETTPCADGVESAVSVMKKYGKTRLVAGLPVCETEKQGGKMLRFFGKLLRSFAPHVFRDTCKAMQVIRDSGLEYTVIRYMNPYLKNTKDGYILSEDGKKVKAGVSAENLARCLYDVAVSGEYKGAMPVVYNKKQD